MEKLGSAQTRLVRKLEVDDAEGILFGRVRERLSELEHERLLKFKELEALEAEDVETRPGAVELLDELSIGEGLFASAPDDVLRQLSDLPSRSPLRQAFTSRQLPGDIDEDSVSPGWCTNVGSAPGGELPTSVHARAGLSPRRLIIAGSFELPKSPWAG